MDTVLKEDRDAALIVGTVSLFSLLKYRIYRFFFRKEFSREECNTVHSLD